ncbi:LPS translocon maturation chaperone LptM [Thalassomonas sp. M1454]|uniref:LPS translocon maturation chaperone LptM n=1 Tax=Thalassomonas sp. M1454 TaxID=2594477 RepID=UPI00163DCD30|nr:lipoprotein [Thalassomonas sp. M1454]
MLNKKLLLVILSTLLCTIVSCGQKGPLYEEQPVAENQQSLDTESAEPQSTEQ